MKQFSVYLITVTCFIISATADKANNNFEPISKNCKKYQNLQSYNMQKCERPILWGSLYCNYECDKAGSVIISECQFKSNDVDYPLCSDLYCAKGKADQNSEGSKKPLEETTTQKMSEEEPKETTSTTTDKQEETTMTTTEMSKPEDTTSTTTEQTKPEETTELSSTNPTTPSEDKDKQ